MALEEADSLISLKPQHQVEQEEQRERLIVVSGPCKVIEYLQPVMSKELLCKFPDNSAFDFDYTQSSIWSPLVPRAYVPMDLDFDFDFVTPRKLTFDQVGLESSNQSSIRKVGSSGKKKISGAGFSLNLSALKNKKWKCKKNKMALASEFSPTPVKGNCNPIASKVWHKVLKAASKHFKKKRDPKKKTFQKTLPKKKHFKKKRDPRAHVRLSNYFKDGNI